MKKVFVLCTILAVMSCLAWAGDLSNTPSNVMTKGTSVSADNSANALNAKEEIAQLEALIAAAKAAGQEPNGAWFARIAELAGPQAARSLDQGGVDWANAVSVPSIPWSDTGTFGSTDACTGRPYFGVMYKLVAALAGNYSFDMCNSAADTYIRYWKNPASSCPTTGSVTSDDVCGNDPQVTNLALVVGDVVYIECGTYYSTETLLTYNFNVNGPTLAPGRCCYGPRTAPTCAINLQSECTTLGGTWTANITDCNANPCPLPPAGEFCENAIAINSLPYTNTNTTCGFTNDYFPSGTLMGSYTTGPDVMYVLTVTERTCITIDIANATAYSYPGVGLFSGCPTATNCLAAATGSSGPLHIGCTELAAGTYYIMVDNWPSPACVTTYDLIVTPCACPQSCDTYVLCGTPAEEEPNGSCADAGIEFQPVIECNSTVFGLICPATDADYWNVVVPPFSKMTFAAYDGEGCTTSPMACLTTQPFDVACASLASASAGTWTLTNSGNVPWSIFMKVAGTCPSTYKLTTTCCPLANPCDMVTDIDAVTPFTTGPVSTCSTDPCGLLAIPNGVYANACAGSLYAAGPSKIYRIHTWAPADLTIDALGTTGQDVQVMVFTDCANAVATCVGSADNYGGSSSPEEIVFTALPAGVYYISISFYGATACGEMSLTILGPNGDVRLPVTMRGEPTATAGDGNVTLNWATASETDNARFEIVRDGNTVASIPTLGNGATGHEYSYTDNGLVNGTVYTYTLRTVDINNVVSTVATVNATPMVNAGAVTEYSLHQNYPNPFNPTTSIVFDMVDAGNVSLKIYNLMGQEVANLVNGPMTAGHHLVSFDAKNLPSGLYLYRLNVNGFNAEKKMLLMK